MKVNSPLGYAHAYTHTRDVITHRQHYSANTSTDDVIVARLLPGTLVAGRRRCKDFLGLSQIVLIHHLRRLHGDVKKSTPDCIKIARLKIRLWGEIVGTGQ